MSHTPETNPIVGGGYASPQSIYETSTTKHHRLGTRGQLGQRVFYYASHVGSGLTIGSLLSRAAVSSSHNSILWSSGGVSNTEEITLTLAGASAAENLYQDGWLIGIDGTGQGQLRVIKEHTSTTSTTGTVTVKVFGPFTVSASTNSEWSLVRNEYDSVIEAPGDAQVSCIGVNALAVGSGSSNAQYFWVQTWGPCAGEVNNSTFVDGDAVTMATGTTDDAGQFAVALTSTASNASVDPAVTIGVVIEDGDSTSDADHMLIDLRIKP